MPCRTMPGGGASPPPRALPAPPAPTARSPPPPTPAVASLHPRINTCISCDLVSASETVLPSAASQRLQRRPPKTQEKRRPYLGMHAIICSGASRRRHFCAEIYLMVSIGVPSHSCPQRRNALHIARFIEEVSDEDNLNLDARHT